MEYFPIKKTTIYDQTAVTVQEMVLTDEAVTANHTPLYKSLNYYFVLMILLPPSIKSASRLIRQVSI